MDIANNVKFGCLLQLSATDTGALAEAMGKSTAALCLYASRLSRLQCRRKQVGMGDEYPTRPQGFYSAWYWAQSPDDIPVVDMSLKSRD